jgi:hypothetical protein
MKSYRGGLPKPDSLGRWRPVVGRLRNGKPQRFQIGNRRDTSEGDALRRLNHIRDLYDRQCADDSIDYWAGWTLRWAQRLAQGVPVRVYASDHARINDGQAAEELSFVYKLQSWGLPIQIADPELQASGQNFLKRQIETEVAKAVEKVFQQVGQAWGPATIQKVQEGLPSNWADAEQRTLHEAIDAYKEHRKTVSKRDNDGALSPSTRHNLKQLDYLKQHHKDISLWQLNLPVLQTMAAYWHNRPPTKKGGRCSWDHAQGMLKQFFRFLSWLDEHPAYKWTIPKGAEKISRSPIKFPTDDRNHNEAFRTITKDTYNVEQLVILVDNVDDFGKALIGVSVNCAFGAAEVGQWPTNLYTLHKAHPHAKEVGFDSTDQDSWITGPRHKTGIYGEHLLWPQVATAVKPFLDGREYLPMTRTGKPWFRPHSANPQTAFQNWWKLVLNRITAQKAHKEFPRLPFGSLRDLLPNVLRAEYGDEVASIALQHGTNKYDNLLDCYANVPFRKLFEATRELEAKFKPFLDKLTKGG